MLACLAVYDVFVSPPQPMVQRSGSHHSGDSDHAVVPKNGNSELDEFWEYDDRPPPHPAMEEDDLATSLRCYRGPAMLAVALFCAAYSLRVWRRNGVACDELIFLPGTPYEFRLRGNGSESEEGSEKERKNSENIEVDEEGRNDQLSTNGGRGEAAGSNAVIEEGMARPIKSCFSEGDAAGGVAKSSRQAQHRDGNGRVSRSLDALELPSNCVENLGTTSARTENSDDAGLMPLMLEGVQSNSESNTPSKPRWRRSVDSKAFHFIRDNALKGLDMLVVRKNPYRPSPAITGIENSPESLSADGGSTKTNEVNDAEYAPSAPSVLGAALDLSLPVLFNFHMFVVLMKDHYKKEAKAEEQGLEEDETGKVDVKDYSWMKPPQIPPKILPLFFITPLILRSMIPPRPRRRFLKTMLQGTILSPFKPVRFREAFVADCVTSMVRPIVDVAYALAYYLTAIFGLLSGKYNLDGAGYLLSRSMFWHGLVAPTLSVSPLVIRFLQTLRQAYDTGKRWPYLGNAFKYATAGWVILYGMTHAEGERSRWWSAGFVCATVYQVVWDSVMDWELLVFVPREPSRKPVPSRISIASLCRRGRDALPRVRLRPKRLFEDDSFYWKALFVNAVLRFCWMAGFIPAYWVSIYSGSTQVTFVDKAHGWAFVLLATLEIFRRCIWSIFKVELETIKLTNGDENILAMASTADEYLKEGLWRVPGNLVRPKCLPPCPSGVVRNISRFRLSRLVRRSSDEDVQAGGLKISDSDQNQYSQLEQSEPVEPASSLDPPKESPEKQKQKYRWLCFSFSNGFLRLLFIFELLIWIAMFLVASYYVVMVEHENLSSAAGP